MMKVEQISVFLENKPGALAEVTRILGRDRSEYPGSFFGRHQRLWHLAVDCQ